jgi:predicted PurR-regulated permease PerM
MVLIATVALGAALVYLAPVVVPVAFAFIFATALSPLADRIERFIPKKGVSAGLCVLLLAAVALGTTGLILSQVGEIVGKSDQYLGRLAGLAEDAGRRTGLGRLIDPMEPAAGRESPAQQVESGTRMLALLRRNAGAIGHWVAQGLGGAVGFLAALAITLSLVFYMLVKRGEWTDRLVAAAAHLGLRPRPAVLRQIREDLGRYARVLALLAGFYALVMTGILMLLGVPNALLWGVLTGLLEVVPFFGPLIAGTLPTLFILGTGAPLWKALAVVGVFVALQLVEQYAVAPVLFGGAVELDPVTVIVVVLAFGLLFGPAGLALALPASILLRALVKMTPDTPALDALVLDPPESGTAEAIAQGSIAAPGRTAPSKS